MSLSYGTCATLEMARNAADQARRDGLIGMYPAACVVLDMHVSNLHAAIVGMLASWDDESDVSVHDRIAQMRKLV